MNAILKPYEGLKRAEADLAAMAELADEDASFEAEIEPVLAAAEKDLNAFELKAMMSGKQDGANAVRQHFDRERNRFGLQCQSAVELHDGGEVSQSRRSDNHEITVSPSASRTGSEPPSFSKSRCRACRLIGSKRSCE